MDSESRKKMMKQDLKYIVEHNLPWHNLDNSTVLISGANGHLPSYMLETLLYLNDVHNKNIKVIALVRNKEKSLQYFAHHQGRKDLGFIFQDVCEPIDNNLKVDYIIHAASQASPKYYEVDPVGTLNANIVGTINLLKLAQRCNSKGFLFFSTGGVLGRIKASSIPAKETDYGYIDPIEIKSCYNQSKKMAENICASWASQYNIPITIVRPSYIYGGRMPLSDGRAFSNFISSALNNEPIHVVDGDRKTRSFCYISDATAAFFTVLLLGAPGQPYNVGIETETTISELVGEILKVATKYNSQISYSTSKTNKTVRRGSIDRSCFDITKIKSLGWSPKHSLADGIKKTLKYYGYEV
mgnify:CR=1 FL=1